MMHEPASLYPVDKNIALKAARAALVHVEQKRAELKDEEEAIIDVRCRKLMGRRFFPPKTVEAARALVLDSEEFTVREWALYGYGLKTCAQSIIDGCMVTVGDIVYLTANDAHVVSNFYVNELTGD